MHTPTYLTYSTVIPVFKYPLEERNTENFRDSFKPLFGKKYNENIVIDKEYAEYVSEKKTLLGKRPPALFFDYLTNLPFIKSLGSVKLVYPVVGDYSPNDFFKSYEISETKKEIKFSFHPFEKKNPEDQRMTFLYYALQKPLYIAAYENGKCVVTGRFFIHLYSCGFITLSIGLALSPQRFSNFETVIPVIEKLTPGNRNTKIPWEWKSKVRNGSLWDITEKVKQLISDSLFETGTFPKANYAWHKSLKIQSNHLIDFYKQEFSIKDYSTVENIKNCILKTGCKNENWDQKVDNSLNYILLSKDLDIHNYNSDNSPRYCLQKYWEYQSIREMVTIKKAIFEQFLSFMNSEIEDLKLWRLDEKEKLLNDKFFRWSAFRSDLSKHVYAFNQATKKLDSFSRKIYSEYSRSIGYQSIHTKMKGIKEDWEKECSEYESSGVKILKNMHSLIETITSLFKPTHT